MRFGRSLYSKLRYGIQSITAPTNITYTINNNNVSYSWLPSSEAVGYRVYDTNDNLIVDLGNVTMWQETIANWSSSVIRKIQAYDNNNIVSEFLTCTISWKISGVSFVPNPVNAQSSFVVQVMIVDL